MDSTAYGKTWLRTNIKTILLTLICLKVSAIGFSQNITLHEKNASLQKVLSDIEGQAPISFVYGKKLVDQANLVTIDVANRPLISVLELVFKDQPITYRISENYIILSPKAGQAIQQDTSTIHRRIDVSGRVVNESGNAVIASVTLKGTRKIFSTNDQGEFLIKNLEPNSTLIISAVNIESKEISLNGQASLGLIVIKTKVDKVGDITVTLSTGYQQIPRERATGSFDLIDNKLLNRSSGSYILDRIENLTPGLLFNKGDALNTDAILIRGRSTIFSNAAPLIVLDNFEYDGDINNINPNDVENISILKDAAASSIWGARAGNGVIVITTKKGKTDRPALQLTSNFSYQKKPDLFNVNSISSSDYIDLEKFLYSQGFYAFNWGYQDYNPPSTPVVELLHDADIGTISPDDANRQIEAMKQYDVRNDLNKYFYQNAVGQQYSLNVSGNNSGVNYYLSGGYDHHLSNLVGAKDDRISFRTQESFNPLRNMQINAGMNFVQTINASGNNSGYLTSGVQGLYPYARLVDDNGNPLPVMLDYSKSLIDQAPQNGLLNWQYKPLADIPNESNQGITRDYLVNMGIRYRVIPFLNLDIKYQYENQLLTGNTSYNDSSYYARNLVNQYTEVNPISGDLTLHIPEGGILDTRNAEIVSHQGRAQLSYNRQWNSNQELDAVAGYEIRSLVSTGKSYRLYGYEPNYSTINSYVDYSSIFPLYGSYYTGYIPNGQTISKTTDHFISYYLNAAYTYEKQYTVSISGRKDAANLFGVQTNEKGTPLWSAGVSWLISNAAFYKSDWLPHLKIRMTYGYNGNISRLASASETISYYGNYYTPALTATIQSPPNSRLRWEKVNMLNFGIDFETRNKRFAGTLEYYQKNANDLMGQSPVDPTLGLSDNGDQSFYYGNVAAMKGNGVDVQLNSINVNGKVKWLTTFLFSHVNSVVSKYLMPVSASGLTYLTVSAGYINPVIGRPVFGLYSYRWAGLDPTDGSPTGYLNGKTSKDYNAIIANTPLDSMLYNGPAQPVYFGALRNTFTWNDFSLSFNISYKFGYYFRRKSISYSYLYNYWTGSGDYAKRWQKSGDEKITNVPSLVYPANNNRDVFYLNSEVLVEKADNIRLEDITVSYEFSKNRQHKIPFKDLRIYANASNLGVIWLANKDHIDPYYNNAPKAGMILSAGFNINF